MSADAQKLTVFVTVLHNPTPFPREAVHKTQPFLMVRMVKLSMLDLAIRANLSEGPLLHSEDVLKLYHEQLACSIQLAC